MSSIFPIMKVMGLNLNDALNYSRGKIKALYVEIAFRSKINTVPIIIGGSILILYSFFIYYTLPRALLSQNYGLMLEVLFTIFMGLFMGLSLVANNVQSYLEVVLTYIFLMCERSSVRLCVLNNFKAHLIRNRQTGRIFTLSLGFIIFLLSSYKLLSDQNQNRNDKRWGLTPTYSSSSFYALNPARIEPVIKRHAEVIDSFSWVTFDIDDISYIDKTYITTPSR